MLAIISRWSKATIVAVECEGVKLSIEAAQVRNPDNFIFGAVHVIFNGKQAGK